MADNTPNTLDTTACSVVGEYLVPAPVTAHTGVVRRTLQRGMATAEYAVGILAAVALALVLLNIFKHSEFFSQMLKFVVDLIAKMSGMLG
ncbi:hypothetical protein HMPREF1531_01294 [Propionibacterium sp. oral taxon 192 str. F0372]|uniref:DUF4244 domain-containing protein n=1 Tax=Propionibacterium sp. oral taxon 192 TaxID=671222 RepID=UPI000353331C|nr:DUF4244 domain-containing protein [Propionibacterium sp. oral taxon 192]EPH03236.1 hypothetical protein HMPREF1531_01294 [Propionibacterium sp. oral taxon 192 str. F0372]